MTLSPISGIWPLRMSEAETSGKERDLPRLKDVSIDLLPFDWNFSSAFELLMSVEGTVSDALVEYHCDMMKGFNFKGPALGQLGSWVTLNEVYVYDRTCFWFCIINRELMFLCFKLRYTEKVWSNFENINKCYIPYWSRLTAIFSKMNRCCQKANRFLASAFGMLKVIPGGSASTWLVACKLV